MSDEWNAEKHGSRRRHRVRHGRRRRRERAQVEELEIEECALTPDERAYRDAQRLAERKVRLTGDALKFGIISTLLLIFVWPIGLVVLIFGGVKVFKDYYRMELEPKLRRRFVHQEVQKQVRATLSQERRELEGEHARSLEQLSASIAHEIRNPITAAKSLVQQLGEDLSTSENVEYARLALDELGRVERSVSHLLRFARDEDLRLAEVHMSEVLDSALETFRDRLARTGIRLEQRIDCEGEMQGDPEKLRRVVINLVGNAIDALVESDTPDPKIAVQMGENLAGSEVWLRVADNGPGIEPQSLQKIFSPFYTSKPNGTGLGLAITKKLVDAHGGTIEFQASTGSGAEFLVTFPKQPRGEGVEA
ncbi:MAG: HAMP domain-containing sensor histidine kinase [Myxococcota bacterium]